MRTVRVEVIRFSRRVEIAGEASVGIEELLAIARAHEITCSIDELIALREPIPVREPHSTVRSRARKLLKKFKP
jgi:hypothetical protein